MSQNDPYRPPYSGQYIPPPPPPPPSYQGGSDIPPQSPYHYSPSAPRSGRNALGWLGSAALAVWAVVKYGLIFVAKVPALVTLLTAVLSVGAYSLLFPWQVAIGLVVMILIHEMGHVVELRRQGVAATAPIFIPFMGAAIFNRTHAQSPLRQAQIGIAGPIAGTLGAIGALALYSVTHEPLYAVWAYWGFWLNLFNLIPFAMLDGGWILAPVSKWVQIAGLALLVLLFFAGFVNLLLIIVVLLGLPMVLRRFREPAYDAYLTHEPLSGRAIIATAWLGLVVVLGAGLYQTEGLLQSVLR